jgi:hypothetical protein
LAEKQSYPVKNAGDGAKKLVLTVNNTKVPFYIPEYGRIRPLTLLYRFAPSQV